MTKAIIRFFISKPILNHMTLFILFALSIFSYLDISKEIFPPSKMDAISISGFYSGASADILDKIAVEEMESDLANISGIGKIISVVKNGSFTITSELKKGVKAKDVIDDIKDVVSANKANFPADMDEPITKIVKYGFPLITVSVSGDASQEELLEVAKEFKRKISYFKDLSDIVIYNESDKEVEIKLNEAKIDAFGLDKQLVITALGSLSSIFPSGVIKDIDGHIYLSSKNDEKEILQLQEAKIKVGNKIITLKDIAKIEYRLAKTSTVSHFNGKLDMSIGINKGSSGDAIKLVEQIKEELKIIQKKHPSLVFDTYADTSVWVKNRLNTVVSNILFGLFLLSMALFLFLNSRVAAVVAIGIPASFMIGLIFANYFDYSLNMLTMLGALIALGMLVDEAIVVGENIYRHLEMGKNKIDAAVDGAAEMFPSVVAATMTTIFAFLPILIMSGQTGKFMQMLPIMITILLFSSLFEAFVFLPLHAKDLYKLDSNKHKKTSNFWDKNKKIYLYILTKIFAKPKISLAVFLVVIAFATFVMFKNIKFQFMPNFDTTEIYISGSTGVGRTIEQTEQMISELEQELLKNSDFKNEIASISSVVGFKLDGQYIPQYNEFYFQIFINLHERAPDNFFDKYINPYLSVVYDEEKLKRSKDAYEIEMKYKEILNNSNVAKQFEEIKTTVPKAGIVKFDIELALSGVQSEVIDASDRIKRELSKINGVINVADDKLLGDFEYKFRVNSYGQSLGIDEKYLQNSLKAFFMEAEYAKMLNQDGIVKVKLQSKNKDDLKTLQSFRINVPNTNQVVHLGQIATIEKKLAQNEIKKENGLKITTITAGVRDITTADVYQKIDPLLQELSKKITIEVKGEEKENKQVKQEMSQAFVIALLLIFATLIWMFDSIVKSLIVLSIIPFSFAGVLVGHYLLGLNLTVSSLIGVVGLAGVVVNDGIIMMDFIQKATNLTELKNYALLRLRPILLTSITTILGLFTLMFFASGQALILQPVAVSIGFGIAWATILNLYLVPLLFKILYKTKE